MDSNPPLPAAETAGTRTFWILLAAIALALCAYLVVRNLLPDATTDEEEAADPAVGLPLPKLSLQGLTGGAEDVELSDLTGKVVLVNFWGTWCGPCHREFPHIVKLNEAFAKQPDFRLLAVSCGATGNDRDLDPLRFETDNFLQGMAADLPIYADRNAATRQAVADLLSPREFGYPCTIVLDRKGIIRGVWVGYSPELPEKMHSLIEKLLKEEAMNDER